MSDKHQVIDDTSQLDLNNLRTQKVGKLNLLTVPEHAEDVSDESLIEFMQDQGFSRVDMAQLLIAEGEGQTSNAQSTAQWLKVKHGDALDTQIQSINESLSVEELKPTNLAEALAAQLSEPRQAVKSSAIVEVFAMKAILAADQIAGSI